METPLVLVNAIKMEEGRAKALTGNYHHVQHLTAALWRVPGVRICVLCDEYTREPLSGSLPPDALEFTPLRDAGVRAADGAVMAAVRRLRPAVYHRPTGQLPFFRLRCRTVSTIADLNFFHMPMSLPRQLYKRLSYWRTIQLADWITCISEFTRQDVMKHYRVNPAKISVIYHGANTLPVQNTDLVTPFSKPFWITFGHQAHKNVETAFKVLMQRPTSESLAVIGAGDHIESKLKPLAKSMNLHSRVHFTGRVSAGDLRTLYSHAVGLLFLSRFEGFGLPILEAMALHCPVISSNACSLPEVVGQAGLIFAPDDQAGIAGGMRRIIEEPGFRERLIRDGIEQAARFTWQRAAESTVDVYNKLLHRA